MFEVAETRPSSVLEMLQDLSAGISCGLRPRVMPASVARQRLVGAAKKSLLRASPEQAPTAADLAATLGVPAPRLWRAIRAQYGMNLQHYLLFCPLAHVHKALRSAVGVALCCGGSHWPMVSAVRPNRNGSIRRSFRKVSAGSLWVAWHHQETAYQCCGMQPIKSCAATAGGGNESRTDPNVTTPL